MKKVPADTSDVIIVRRPDMLKKLKATLKTTPTKYTFNDNGETDEQEDSLWQADVLAKDVEVEVTGNSAFAAIQCLIDKGLFEDYAEYQRICEENGLDHEKVKAGTFTFKKGSTKNDIAKEMNWG